MAKANEVPAPETEEADTEETTRRMDPELRVMGQMVRLMETIDEPARGRAIEWLRSRYPMVPCGVERKPMGSFVSGGK